MSKQQAGAPPGVGTMDENLEGLISALRRAKSDIEYAICYRNEGEFKNFADLELVLAEIDYLGRRASEIAPRD